MKKHYKERHTAELLVATPDIIKLMDTTQHVGVCPLCARTFVLATSRKYMNMHVGKCQYLNGTLIPDIPATDHNTSDSDTDDNDQDQKGKRRDKNRTTFPPDEPHVPSPFDEMDDDSDDDGPMVEYESIIPAYTSIPDKDDPDYCQLLLTLHT